MSEERVDAQPEYTPEEKAYLDSRGGEKEAVVDFSEVKEAVKGPEPPEPTKEEPKEAVKEEVKTEAKEQPRMVDYRALAEARTRLKEAQERAHKSEVMQARMEERFKALMPQEQAKVPTPDEDIFGNVNYLNQKLGQLEQQERAELQQENARHAQEQAYRRAVEQEQQFKKDHSDYEPALVYLREIRRQELTDMGYAPENAAQQVYSEEMGLIRNAQQAGKNPAEWAYNIAKRRGFNSKPPAPNLEQKLDTIEAGQKASQTLSGVGGKSGGGEITLEALAKMSDEDFGKFKATSPAKYRRLMGATH